MRARPSLLGNVNGVEHFHPKSVDNSLAFVRPYLDERGVKFGICWRVKQWLNRWEVNLKGQA